VTGVAAELISIQQAGAFGLFRREDEGLRAGQGVNAFKDRDPDNGLARQGGADQAKEHCSGADGAEDVGIAAGVDYSKDLFTAPDTERAGASFRDDISAGVPKGELMEKMGTALFGVVLAADEFQLHSIVEGGRQGGGKGWRFFTADHADGVEPGLMGGAGRCKEVVGPGAAESDDRTRG